MHAARSNSFKVVVRHTLTFQLSLTGVCFCDLVGRSRRVSVGVDTAHGLDGARAKLNFLPGRRRHKVDIFRILGCFQGIYMNDDLSVRLDLSRSMTRHPLSSKKQIYTCF